MVSVCGPETLREISSPGKSGSLLFTSKDGRFVIKTLRKHEVKVLCKMLPNYLYHVKQYRTSLLIKLYGLHAVRPIGGRKVYFVVMENVLQLDVHMHRSYDLKGSSQGRTISKYSDHERATFKDLDLDFIFYLNPQTRHNLLEQIKYDCGFLEAQGIMDYSLLLGIHLEARNQGNKSGARYDSLQACGDFDWALADIYQSPGRPGAKFGVKIPARAVRVPRNRKDGLPFDREAGTGECYDALLYIGIIDILQVYNVKKHLEHAYKSIRYDSKSISAVNPKVYSARLLDFLCEVFLADEVDL